MRDARIERREAPIILPLVIFTLVPDPFRPTYSPTLALKYGLFCSLISTWMLEPSKGVLDLLQDVRFNVLTKSLFLLFVLCE